MSLSSLCGCKFFFKHPPSLQMHVCYMFINHWYNFRCFFFSKSKCNLKALKEKERGKNNNKKSALQTSEVMIVLPVIDWYCSFFFSPIQFIPNCRYIIFYLWRRRFGLLIGSHVNVKPSESICRISRRFTKARGPKNTYYVYWYAELGSRHEKENI